MKTVYIPKGEIVRYESLMTEHLVVHGCLQVSNGIKARTITGQGTISAGTIDADVIRVDDVEAGSIVCKRLLAKRVQSPEVFVSESATVTCFLAACYVETGRLTVTLSEIDEVKAEEVVNLTPKKRTLFGTLFASLLRSIWTVLTVPGQKEPTVMTDDCEEVPEDVTEPVPEETQEPEAEQAAPCEEENAVEPEAVDEELNRIVGIFKLAREQGYTLKLIPGTPEENAPVFDFENERILRPAAYANVDVYYYCKSGSMVTVMFIIPSQNATVIDGSKTTLYLSNASKSDLIHDTDGDYFTYNAVVDGKIETVKVDVDAKCGAETADKLDGLYSDYTVSSKGYITGLTKYGSYPVAGTSAKTAVNGVAGIDKTSKEYTVKLELQAGDTYQYTITCADDMKVFYVDKDGNITESSYAAIYPDNNDLVYAVVDKYLVKTLVIFEVEDPTTGSTTATYNFTAGDATVSTQNNASYWLANVQVKKAAFVPNTAKLKLTYDVYLDGMLYAANQTAVNIPATQSVVTLSGTGFFADSKVEVVVKDLTTDKVAVRYLDADNNKEIPASDFVSKTDTANVGTKSAIPFQLKTGKTGDVTYEVYQGTTKLWTGSSNAVDASRAGTNSVADWTGNNFVDVKIIGMSALTTLPATYSFTNNTTDTGFTTGVTGETAKVQVAATSVTGQAYNTQVSATIKLTGTPAVAANFGYKVECSKLGVSAIVNNTAGETVTFRLTKDVTITDADFTVTPVAKLAVTGATWDAGKIVLTFNHDVEAVLTAPATSLTVGASSSDINITVAIASSSADWTAVVSGNTLTVTAGTGNFAAADKIQIVTNKVVSSVTGESFNGLTTAKALSDLNTLVH